MNILQAMQIHRARGSKTEAQSKTIIFTEGKRSKLLVLDTINGEDIFCIKGKKKGKEKT